MRDVLIGGGGVRAARVGTDLEHLPCAPLVVIGNSGSKDPLGGNPASDAALAMGPTDGLWLIDVFPVERGASINSTSALVSSWSGAGPAGKTANLDRVALLCEMPLSNPPSLMASVTLLAGTCLIVGSEMQVCLTLYTYVSRMMVLRTGMPPAPPPEHAASYMQSRSAYAEFARECASKAAAAAGDLRLPWPVALPQLRVVIGEPSMSSASPSGKSSLADAVAGVSPAEIDALIRAAGEHIFSSVVITRCRDGDVGSVTRDIVVHAPARRLQAKGYPLTVKAWLGVTATAYARLHGWRHIAGRSSTDEVCAAVAEAVAQYRDASGGSALPEVNLERKGLDGSTVDLPSVVSNIVAAHREAATFATARSANASIEDASASFFLAADAARRKNDAASIASARERTERALRLELESHWKSVAAVPSLATAHGWIDGVTETLREFRRTCGRGAADGNRAIVNAALVDVLLQWALPNASAASRVATDALQRQLEFKADELRRSADDAKHSDAAHAARVHAEHLDAALHETDARHRALRQAVDLLRQRCDAYTREQSASVENWKRRFAAREFMASNVSGGGGGGSPSRGAPRFSVPGGGTAATVRASDGGTFDERAVKAELDTLYEGFDDVSHRVANFAADLERLQRNFATAGVDLPVQTTVSTATPDTSAINIMDFGRQAPGASVAADVRAARAAAAAAGVRSTSLGIGHVVGAPTAGNRSHLSAPTLTPPNASDIDDDDDAPRRQAPLSGAPRTVGVARPATSSAKFVALLSPRKEESFVGGKPDLLAEYGGAASIAEVEALRNALDKVTAALASLQSTYDSEQDGHQRMVEERHQHLSRIDEDAATIRRLMQDNNLLRTEINRLFTASKEADRLKLECEGLEYKSKSQATALDCISRDKSRIDSMLAEQIANASALEKRVSELSVALHAARETADSSSIEVQELRAALYAAKSAQSLAEHNVASLTTELAVVRAESRQADMDSSDTLRNVENARDEVAAHNASLQNRVRDLERQLDAARAEVAALQDDLRSSKAHFEASDQRLRQNLEWQQQALDATLQREQQAQAAHASAYHDFTRALVERDSLKAGLQEREKRVERAAKSISLLRDENNTLRRHVGLPGGATAVPSTSAGVSSNVSSFALHSTEWYAHHTPLTRVATSQPRPLPTGAAALLNQTASARSSPAVSEPDASDAARGSRSASAQQPGNGATDSASRLYAAPRPLPSIADELLRSPPRSGAI